jgi:hypothetical protein
MKWLAAALVLFLVACGDDAGGPDGGVGAGDASADADPAAPDADPTRPDAGPLQPDASAVCNQLDNPAAAVERTFVAQAPPAPQGGTILDGTYHRTGHLIYTGSGGQTGGSGQSFRETAVIGGGTYDHVLEAVGASVELRQTHDLATSGTEITLTRTCGTLTIPLTGYTVTDGGQTLILYGDEQAGPFALTLTRQ